MKIYNNLSDFRATNPVVTIGTFDGVHLGHLKVLDRLKELALKAGGESVVFTFHPHPRVVVKPDEQSLRLLTTLDEKIERLQTAGIDHLIVFPFTTEFAALSYDSFVEQVLVNQIKTHTLVVGYDHKFGKDREGGFEYLKACAEQYRFEIEKLDVLLLDEANISSTRIRSALELGLVDMASSLLGYNYRLSGTVVEGQRLGRTIGFPTANIVASDVNKLIPGYGVYAVRVQTDGNRYEGMLNIGTRPTFNNNADKRSIEVNIFDFNGDIYGAELRIFFIAKIREEQKFPDKNALIAQLHIDRLVAQKLLSS